ncbi:hypothetical protein BaRGS_00027867, partial [Batillaria attramentaria]
REHSTDASTADTINKHAANHRKVFQKILVENFLVCEKYGRDATVTLFPNDFRSQEIWSESRQKIFVFTDLC